MSKSTVNNNKSPRWLRRVITALWLGLAGVVLGSALLFTAIGNGWIGYLPPIAELENPNYKFASEAISSDGQLLGTYALSKENRIYTPYDDIPPALIQALIATEDIRFYEHAGIDFRGVGRALVKRGVLQQSTAGGGSTITQQLSKLLYSPIAQNKWERLLQKPTEWAIAVQLERVFTKEEILTLYLNKYDWGYNAIGVHNAAKTYFNKEVTALTVEECAMLVGMCQNSSLYNPVRRDSLTQQRRNVVLSQMLKTGGITDQQYDSLKTIPISLNFHPTTHKSGLATYFRDRLRRMLMAQKPSRSDYASWQHQSYYDDSLAWQTDPLYGWCNKNRKKNGDTYNIYIDGLRIYTTIDSRCQQYAEAAMREHLGGVLQPAFFDDIRGKRNAPFQNLTDEQVRQALERSMKQSDRYRAMHGAGIGDDKIRKTFNSEKQPMTVFTWAGPKDTLMTPMDSLRYYKSYLRAGIVSMEPSTGAVRAYVGGPDFAFFQYDMAMEGRRQVGSTMKPFVYALAMEHGMTPCDEVLCQPYTIGNWTPRNSSTSHIGEYVSLRWGLQNSNNWITAYLMTRLSPYEVRQMVWRFGVQTQNIHPSAPICLGPCDISVGEMASAYTAFANGGLRTAPLLVTRIEDADGNLLAQFTSHQNEVMDELTAQNMLSMLTSVVNGGTGSRLRTYTRAQAGGKTGTTQRNSDGWFVGFTPSLVTACWIGGEDRDIHFRTMALGQGARMALPIFGLYMKKIFADGTLPYRESETFRGGTASICTSDSIYGGVQELPIGISLDAIEIETVD